MKFRPHRGLLEDAMRECIELPDSMLSLRQHIYRTELWVVLGTVEVTPYAGADERIGWDETFLVTGEEVGTRKRLPIGFTDLMAQKTTEAQRFQATLEEEGIYAGEGFAEAALNHPRLKAMHTAMLKKGK